MSYKCVSLPLVRSSISISARTLSTTCRFGKESYKVLVLGGGSGGSSVSARFARKLGKGKVAVIEPSDTHYYQPMWTLVGGGMKRFEESSRSTKSCLHSNVDWIKDSVAKVTPKNNTVLTKDGKEIEYDYLVVALGLQLRYDMVKGLPEAFETPGVCSTYSKQYVHKVLPSIKALKSGDTAIFTFPATPIKCPGAPQKICYITEHYLRRHNIPNVNIMYNTSLPVIFGVPKYAAVLSKIAAGRGITVNMRHNLIEVNPSTNEAVFALLGEDGKPIGEKRIKYNMLHVGAPCSPVELLRQTPELTDAVGFLDVDKTTLQSKKFSNVFGIGDCANTPNPKTAAAVAAQSAIVARNLQSVMDGKDLKEKYDGYTSCPLVTGYDKCVLAEFDYNLQPLETFPFDQGKERRSMFHFKRDFIPRVYWSMLVKGLWNGPKIVRKAMHLGMSN